MVSLEDSPAASREQLGFDFADSFHFLDLAIESHVNGDERKPVQSKSRTYIRLLVVTRFTRLHPGAQKGGAANYLLAVRTAPQAKPLY
jgi:hypothetical protein